MKKINELLKEYSIKPYRYTKEGKVTIIDTDDNRYVIKEKASNNLKIYNYLASRNFNYYPKILNSNNDDYQIMEYIDEYDIPDEQKMMDLIDLVSLLHSKTTHFKETDEDDYKEIYEDISSVNSIFGNFSEQKESYKTYKVYIVREGDSIDTILQKYSVSREILEKYNNLNEINLGDKIIIPSTINEKD